MSEIQLDGNDFIKEHYVYELFDKRQDNTVFYVGEGVKERANQHLIESQRNLKLRDVIRQDISEDPTLGGKLDSAKTRRIEEIIESGAENLGVRVIGRFGSKEESTAVEAVLINWVYGHRNLTNVSRGRGADHVRQKDQLTEELERLDIPKQRRIKVFGAGAEDVGETEKHKVFGHLQMAETIAEYIRQEFPTIQVDEPCFWESGRYVGVFVTLVPETVRMIIQLTSSDKNQHVYNLKPLSERKEDVKNFSEFLHHNYGLDAQNGGRYTKILEWNGLVVKNDQLDEVARQVRLALEYFGKYTGAREIR